MKNKTNLFGFSALAILCFAFSFGVSTAAQESRPRVKTTPTPQQTPSISPAPKPTVAPSISPTPIQIQTVAELQSKIRLALARSELRRGTVGVKIVSLDTNQTIFEENAEKYFMPASNMKSYTVAAAIEKLSPDFRFVTSVYAPAAPAADGVVKGDLTVYGRGDVSISSAFNDGDYYRGLDALANKIVQAGVKRIEGNLIGDESYFTGNPIPQSWEWDDLQWYYGAEISALPINDNALDLSVKPSALNAPCFVQTLPANTIIKIINRCVTVAAGTKRDVRVFKKLDQNTVEVGGTISVGDEGYKGAIAVSRPAQIFVELLRGLLMQKGVIVTGQNRVVNAQEKALMIPAPTVMPVEIAKLESPPLSVIAAKTLKPSQNAYTETILWTLGQNAARIPTNDSNGALADPLSNQRATSAERGLFVVQNFLQEIGVPSGSVIQWDGSGLSRHNLITPASAVQLFTFMSKSRYANHWRDALTVAGVDGTLKNRFKGTIAVNNVRGKTGTIDQVSSLSGYVTTAAGERMVFSVIVNGVNSTPTRQAAIDEIVVALAAFNGKTN